MSRQLCSTFVERFPMVPAIGADGMERGRTRNQHQVYETLTGTDPNKQERKKEKEKTTIPFHPTLTHHCLNASPIELK
jgi:hypothetical protein